MAVLNVLDQANLRHTSLQSLIGYKLIVKRDRFGVLIVLQKSSLFCVPLQMHNRLSL